MNDNCKLSCKTCGDSDKDEKSDDSDKDDKEGNILLTKITAAQNKVTFCHHRVRGLYFWLHIFAATIIQPFTNLWR